jgi:hypothetical protein
MSDDQFTKLFKYMNEQFDAVNKKLDEKASQDSVDRLINTVDGFAKRVDDYDIENAARDSQFSRLATWAKTAGNKIGVEFVH